MLTIILLLIASYLLGAIPFGLWIGKIFFKKNLHDYGSGNTGTTNTFRILLLEKFSLLDEKIVSSPLTKLSEQGTIIKMNIFY